MSAVWYVGTSDVRTITAADWAAAGITGVSDVTWNKTNGWSVAATSFNGAQLALLALLPEFNTTGADGPRAGSGTSPLVGSPLLLSGSPVDGQTVIYNAALGLFIPVAAAGASELAYIENATAVVQTCAANAGITLTGSITVPVSTRPVYLRAGFAWKLTTAGVGDLAVQWTETTSGAAVPLLHNIPIIAEPVNPFSSIRNWEGTFRIGPVASPRSFRLAVFLVADSGTPAISVYNGANTAGGGACSPSWIMAEAK